MKDKHIFRKDDKKVIMFTSKQNNRSNVEKKKPACNSNINRQFAWKYKMTQRHQEVTCKRCLKWLEAEE